MTQAATVSTAVALIKKNALVRLKEFRFAYLHLKGGAAGAPPQAGVGTAGGRDVPGGSCGSTEIFSHPLALHRLAEFLIDMHRENGRWTGPGRSLPLVLAPERAGTGTYLVAGYNFPERHGDVARSWFGADFDQAARSLKGKFVLDRGFDGSVAEVDADMVQRFIEQHHYLMHTN